ncbi:MAG: LuxR C-terminal-related transcriptional regulator [Thermomicrobiales bacterium]
MAQPDEGSPEGRPAGTGAPAGGNRLPALPTLMVGRERELAAIGALFADASVRVVTLVGPGGVGKTRLAIEFAASDAASTLGSTWFVPLAPITDPALIPQAMMRALGLEAISGMAVLDVLAARMGEERMLLVVDNVEHVVEGASRFAALLQRCPGLRMIATSRVPLDISGEHILRLQPLPVPEPATHLSPAIASQSSAVRLFVDRATAVFAEFQLTASNAADVAEICRRLDGLPLAIELAASRSGQFSPRILAERLASRMNLLAAGPRDAPGRHQTLQATVAWSVELLPEDGRRLWRWLGLCEGGFSLETAEAFAPVLAVDRDAIAPIVETLAHHSLVLPIAGRSGEPRFLMLETTRQVAIDALADDPRREEAWDALAGRLAAFCREAEPGLMGPDSVTWFHRVEDELPGIRAVLARARDRGDVESALRMLGDLGWFWTDPTYVAEGRAWLEPLLARADETVAPIVRAKASSTAGMLANWHDDQEVALGHATTAIALWRELGDDARIAESAINLGNVDLDLQRDDAADQWFREAQVHAQAAGDPWLIAAAANLRGVVAANAGQYREAIHWHEAAIRGWEAAGFLGHVITAVQSLAWTRFEAGDIAESRRAYRRILALAADSPDVPEVPVAVMGAALFAHREGRDALATRLLAAGVRERERLGLPLRPRVQERIDSTMASLRESLGPVGFTRAWTDGRAMSSAEARAATAEVLGGDDESLGALSPREREVLQLMMDGTSDEDIAAALFISRRTASKHVASILEKLDAPNRTAAVSLAIRRGIV